MRLRILNGMQWDQLILHVTCIQIQKRNYIIILTLYILLHFLAALCFNTAKSFSCSFCINKTRHCQYRVVYPSFCSVLPGVFQRKENLWLRWRYPDEPHCSSWSKQPVAFGLICRFFWQGSLVSARFLQKHHLHSG